MPTLDRQGLEDEFNMATEVLEPEIVEDEADPFELEWEEDNSDGNVLRRNIIRANTVLDKVTEELTTKGNFSARLVEVAGQIINTISTASKVLIDDTNYNKYLDIRKALALLKKREVEIKAIKSDRPINQNLIVASREDVLKLLREKPEPRSIEPRSETNE